MLTRLLFAALLSAAGLFPCTVLAQIYHVKASNYTKTDNDGEYIVSYSAYDSGPTRFEGLFEKVGAGSVGGGTKIASKEGSNQKVVRTGIKDGTKSYFLRFRQCVSSGGEPSGGEPSCGNPYYIKGLTVVVDSPEPQVSLTQVFPQPGKVPHVGETILLKANASVGAGSIKHVDFHVGGVSIEKVTAPPYEVEWVPKTSGTFAVDAIAEDNNKGEASVRQFTLVKFNSPPAVSFSQPAPGANGFTQQKVKIKANPSDQDGTIDYVDMYASRWIDGDYVKQHLTRITSPPYEYDWTPTTPGSIELNVRAYDDDGDSAQTIPRWFIVKNTPPVINLLAPANNSQVLANSLLKLEAQASDVDGPVSVDFFINNTLVGSDNSPPFSQPWSPPSTGNYSFHAVARDTYNDATTSAQYTLNANKAAHTGAGPGPLIDSRYDVFYGDLDNKGGEDIYFHSKNLFLLIHGRPVTPLNIKNASFVVYQTEQGYSQPQLLKLTDEQRAQLRPAGSQDVFFADFNGDKRPDVLLRGATVDDPALILAGRPHPQLPELLVTYADQYTLEHFGLNLSNRDSVIVLRDQDNNGVIDIVVVGEGPYGGDAHLFADDNGIPILEDIDPSLSWAAISSAGNIPDHPATNFSPIEHDATVGAVAGSASVNGGSASYNIPVQVPPGRAGVQPKLSIAYSSRGGNGNLGMGFSLSGSSAISRCGQTIAHDGRQRGVTYSATQDRLCWNGQRLLVSNSGTYGAITTEYRAELDNFVRITQHGGGINSSNAYFTATYKDGSVEHYGSSTDSRVTAKGAPAVSSWLIKRYEDFSTSKNSIIYKYEDFQNGEVHLKDIYYTGKGSTQGNRRVELVYDARDDISSAYHRGGLTALTQRVDQINTYVGNAVIKRYKLRYEASAASRRSLLKGVQECGFDSDDEEVCLPETTFDWLDAKHQYVLEPLGYKTSADGEINQIPDDKGFSQQLPRGDTDGDGTPNWPDWKMNAEGIGGTTPEVPTTCERSGITMQYQCFTADFNLDGLADNWSWNSQGKFTITYSAQSGTGSTIVTPVTVSGSRSVDGLVDMNGDGWPDLVYTYDPDGSYGSQKAKMYLSLHSGNTASPYSAGQEVYTYDHAGQIGGFLAARGVSLMGDMDGNGTPDFVVFDNKLPIVTQIWTTNGQPTPIEILFTEVDNEGAVSFETYDLIPHSLGIGLEEGEAGEDGYLFFNMFMDVNGDGLSDWLAWKRSGDNRIWLSLNKGGTFDSWQNLGSNSALATRMVPYGQLKNDPAEQDFAFYPRYGHALQQHDIDADGRAELLVPYSILSSVCMTYRGKVKDVDVCGSKIFEPLEGRPDGVEGGVIVVDKFGSVDDNIYQYQAMRFVEKSPGVFEASRHATNIVGSAKQTSALDAFANGLSDMVFEFGARYSSHTFTDPRGLMEGYEEGLYINRNVGSATNGERYQPTDMLIGVTDGVGVRNEWDYRPLSSHDAQYHSTGKPFYEPDFGYLDTLSANAREAHMHFTSSMYVVAEHRTSSGVYNELNSLQYRYKGAMLNRQGRGFQGFRTVIVEDPTSGIHTQSDFHQVFPLAGKLHKSRQWLMDDASSDSGLLSTSPFAETDYAWQFRDTLNDGSWVNIDAPTDLWSTATGSTYFVGLDTQSTHRRTLDSSVRSLTHSTTESRDFDAWGNITLQTKEYKESGDKHLVLTEVESDYDDSVHNSGWYNKIATQTSRRFNVESRLGVAIAADTDNDSHVTISYEEWDTGVRKPTKVVTTPSSGKAVTVVTGYNSDGLPTSVTTQTVDQADRLIDTQYTSDGYFPRVVTNTYGHELETNTHAGFGVPRWVDDANDLRTDYGYDAFGRVTETELVGSSPPVYTSLTTVGRLDSAYVIVTQQEGTPTKSRYVDKLGRVIRERIQGFSSGDSYEVVKQYNARGLIAFESFPKQAPVLVNVAGTHYTDYDALGRLTAKTVDQATRIDPLNITYVHDQGLRGFTTDITADTLTMSRTYNGLGQLIQTTDAKDGVTKYAYDGGGNPIVMQDANQQSITAKYNALGQKEWVDDPNMGKKTFFYNGFGEIDYETDANKDTVRFAYDSLGRPTDRYVNGKLEAEWEYDSALNGLGLLTEESLANGDYFKTYEYDTQSRVQAVTHQLGSESFVVRNHYDSYLGRAKGLEYPNGLILEYQYNDQGYPAALTNPASGYEYRTINAMDVFGNVTQASIASGTSVMSRSYYDNGQAQEATLTNLLGTLHHQAYTRYDIFGNLEETELEVPSLSPATNTETFHYDELQRLTLSERSNGATIDYDYDAVGNLLLKDDYASTYHYDDARPNAVSSVALIGGGSKSFGYDGNGNRTHENNQEVLRYNAFNKPTWVKRQGTELQFAYGANLARYKQVNVTTGETTLYVDKLFEKITKGDKTTLRLFIEDVAVMSIIEEDGELDHEIGFTHRDRLGSAVAIVDHLGILQETQSFDPFGKPRAGNLKDKSTPILASQLTTRGFTDHEHLDGVQLIHMNGRAYDYNLGRFLSVDPFVQSPGNSQSLNPYSYIMNNPMSGTDPSGYKGESADQEELTKTVYVQENVTGQRLPRTTPVKVSVSSNGQVTGGSGVYASARAVAKASVQHGLAIADRSNVSAAVSDGGASSSSVGGTQAQQGSAQESSDPLTEEVVIIGQVAAVGAVPWIIRGLIAAAGGGTLASQTEEGKKATDAAITNLRGNSTPVSSGPSGGWDPDDPNNPPGKLYRVLRSDESVEAGVVAKNPSARYTVEGHVINGSRSGFKSQYISTTTDINVARYWASKTGGRIVEINSSMVNGSFINLSTTVGRQAHLRGASATNFAKKSSEVLIKGSIPPKAMRLVK